MMDREAAMILAFKGKRIAHMKWEPKVWLEVDSKGRFVNSHGDEININNMLQEDGWLELPKNPKFDRLEWVILTTLYHDAKSVGFARIIGMQPEKDTVLYTLMSASGVTVKALERNISKIPDYYFGGK